MKSLYSSILFLCFFGFQISAQNKVNPEKASSPSSISLEKLIQQKSAGYVITSEHVSRVSGVRHVYLRQAINGIEVYGTESSVHIDRSGKVVMSHNRFLNDISATLKSSAQALSAQQAISSVARQMNYKVSGIKQLKNIGGVNKQALFNNAGISSVDIPIKLMYYYQKGKGTSLVWELSIAELDSDDWWDFRVDAANGKIIDKDNWTLYCNILGDHSEHDHGKANLASQAFIGPLNKSETITASSTNNATIEASILAGSYRVYAMPTESPNHGPRTLVANPDNALASPFGWHDTNGVAGPESTLTIGNNVWAQDDINGNNGIDGYSPDGTGALVFDFPIDLTQPPNTNLDPNITNLFYWNNIIHDVIYQYGFDEVSGNFQENNYGNGGLGSDSVWADAQNPGDCNANFGTPVDGNNPRMQMFLCSNSTPSHDGDLDNMVIVHEYGHGISNRLTGGPANSSCLSNQEQMGEGWSDYYGLMLTMEVGDLATDSRGVGTYLFGQPINGPGIRPYPYDIDLADNPHTYGDLPSVVVPHGVGSVWAMMLWEMTWQLIDDYGFDPNFYTGNGGNNIALTLVTEGLKLQPCSPGFVDGRDAILAADMALYGGVNQCSIWDAFAKRGLGFSANQGSTNSTTDGTEAFDLPPSFSSFNTISEVCFVDGIQTGLSGGNPTGGVYSGPGVTDDGNGTTYTFDPSVGGPGLVTVSYQVNDFCTGAPTTLNDDINVTDEPPVILCKGSGTIPMNGSASVSPGTPIPNNTTITSTINVPENVVITDLNVDLNITHTWVGDLVITLESPNGTIQTILNPPDSCSGDDAIISLDDEAPTTSTACYGNPAYPDPSYQPFAPLTAFDGENTAGIWTLRITDIFADDPGVLVSWGLNYSYDFVSPPLDVFLDGSGNATINASDLLESATVACGGLTIEGGSPVGATVSFTTADIGLTNVDMVVTSDTGQVSTCIAVANVIAAACDLTVTGFSSTPLSCPSSDDGSITITATCTSCTGIDYTITPTAPPGPAITQTNDGVFLNLPPNTYNATVADTGDPSCSVVISSPFVITAGVDSTPPAITCPANATVECGGDTSPMGTGSATATDTCDTAPAIMFADTSAPGCGNTEVITRVWTATDASGNSSTCTQTITVVDTTSPSITCPPDATVECGTGGTTTGTATAVYTGGTQSWSSVQTGLVATLSADVVGIPATATITDVNVSFDIDHSWVGDLDITLISPDGGTVLVLADPVCGGSGNSDNVTVTLDDESVVGSVDANCIGGVSTGGAPEPDSCPMEYLIAAALNGSYTPDSPLSALDGGLALGSWTLEVVDDAGGDAGCIHNFAVFVDWIDNSGGGTNTSPAVTGTATATDGCGVATVSYADTSVPSCGNTEVITRTWTATDECGNQSSCVQIITVEDNTPPVVSCPGNISVNNDPGVCGAVVTYVVDGTDTCGGVTVSQTGGLASGATFPVGLTTNTFDITDDCGNTTICSFDVLVTDIESPVAICPADITVSNDPGSCDAVVSFVASGTDNCPGLLTSSVPASGSAFPVGTTVVTVTATDASGNIDVCTFNITVTDNEAPVIICPADIVQSNDPGVCEAFVTVPAPTFIDNCSVGGCYQTDDLEAYALGSIYGQSGDWIGWTGMPSENGEVSLEQALSGTQSLKITGVPAGGPVDQIYNLGNATTGVWDVTYHLYIPVGNTAFTNIQKFEQPGAQEWGHQIQWNSDGTAEYNVNFTYNTFTYPQGTWFEVRHRIDLTNDMVEMFLDNASIISHPYSYQAYSNNGSLSIGGINFYPATNLFGVNSNEPNPSAIPLFYVDDVSICAIPINDYNNTSDASDIYPVGTTNVIWTVTDPSGNSNSCTQVITIEDNEDPVIVCPADITVNNDPGVCGAVVDYELGFQNIIFSQSFTQGVSSGDCGIWNTFQSQLLDGLSYTSVKLSGSNDPTGITLADPAKVLQLANALRTNTPVTIVDGPNTWRTGGCGGGTELSVNQNICLCNNPGFSIRPCIGNSNWGGINSATCAGPTQTMTVEFIYNAGGGPIVGTDNCPGATTIQTTGLASGSVFPVGTTTNTFVVTDASGNTTNCSFDVTVIDTENPVVLCPADITQDNDPGVCEAVVIFTPTANDNCGIASIVSVPASGSAFPVGTTTVTVTATDTSGNTDVCTFDITVEDNEDPVITCAPNGTRDTDPGVCEYTVVGIEFDATFTDNCTAGSITNDLNGTDTIAGEILPLGNTTVVWIVDDGHGQTATCTTVITVEDNEDPVITCAPNGTRDTDPGVCEYTVQGTEFDATFTDNCTAGSISNDLNGTDTIAGEILPLGNTTVVWTADDGHGQTATCTTVITVEDNELPMITCPADVNANTDPGICGAEVFFADAIATDNCGVLSVVQTNGLPSGSIFPVGVSTVEFTATDVNGNSSVCSFTITITDNEAPMAVCQDITIQLDEFGDATITPSDIDGGSSDNCAIDTITASQTVFDCSDVGPNDVTLTVTDIYGNVSTCIAVVTVEDVTAPIAVCQNITVELDENGTITITGADVDGGSTDACGIASYELDIDTFDCSNVGDNVVVLTVTDVNGNVSTCTAIVTVEDNTSPELICMDITVELDENGQASITAEDVIASNTDACGILTTAVDIPDFSCDDIGDPIMVTVFSADVNGNLSSCTAFVTVVDLLAPVIENCPEDQTVDPGPLNLFYELPDYWTLGATATDNCTDPVTILGQDPAPGTLLPDGVYTITLTAEDEYGNVGTCIFELTVESLLGIGDNDDISTVVMYPNPASAVVNISNPQAVALQSATIYDMTGKLIKVYDLKGMGVEKSLDIAQLATATYMVIIQSENGSIYRQLIKE